ncbi:MAG: hypothetical protein FWD17_14490 [Polyangiaceae bacterium]|nr:hypothetical protein [Polyangiaceae bacterium]
MNRTLATDFVRPGLVGRELTRTGYVRLATALERDAASIRLCDDGWLVVAVEIDAPMRGRLYEAIDASIERELGEWHACEAGSGCAGNVRANLVDQLGRASRAGARGIAIFLNPLRAAAGPMGALEPRDSAALRFLAEATRAHALALWLDERDGATGGYGDPVPLSQLLAPARDEAGRSDDPLASPTPTPMPMPIRQTTPAPPTPTTQADDPLREKASAPAPLAPARVGVVVAEAEEVWRSWALQLVAARGPQPLSALEKLFTDSYVPLSNAIAGGLDDARAKSAHDEFRQTFARGYADAFATFAVTTKRPRMVLDAHDVAARIARLHGARSTRLLLVDSMRWDVSRLVEQQLGACLGSRAAITDEMLLWSALPTTTMRQLETIARGVDALRSPAELDADADLPRGRTAEYIRRLRVGSRELHKLDLVESRLVAARGAALRSIPAIAEAAAEAIARHADSLAPHTLLFVFGDHGFTIDRAGSAQQGGASPEEVLVGAFSVLVGAMH